VIYLDYQATTPLAPEARAAMLPWLAGPEDLRAGYANPHSPHRPGRAAAAAVEAARAQVAALFPPGGRVIFTSGATEALNLAIAGSGRRRLAVSAIEHAAVLDTARFHDPALTVLPVDGAGLVDPAVPIPEGTGVVAVMQVNNEIGTVQPVAELAARACHRGAVPVRCGAGGGQAGRARRRRSGGDFRPQAAWAQGHRRAVGARWGGAGPADPWRRAGGRLALGHAQPRALCRFRRGGGAVRKVVEKRWRACGGAVATGARAVPRLDAQRQRHAALAWQPQSAQAGLDVARLLSECRSVAFSAGSACASGSGRPSHVLRALGLSDREVKTAIRIGFGRYTRAEELEEAAAALNAAAQAQGV
jgi:cysteine desulfurase